MFRLLSALLLIYGAVSVSGDGDTHIETMLKLLSKRLDRNAMDLLSLESRMQSQFNELKEMIGTLEKPTEEDKANEGRKVDESLKGDIMLLLQPIIESSIRSQAAVVHRAFAAEKQSMRRMKAVIETQVTDIKLSSTNKIQSLQMDLNEVQTGLKTMEQNIVSLQTSSDKNVAGIAKQSRSIDSIVKDFNAKLDTIENVQQQQQRSVSSVLDVSADLKDKWSELEIKTNSNSGKILSNVNEISVIRSAGSQSVHTAFSTRLSKQLPNHPKRTKILFDHVYYNEGKNYDKSTGIFTTPVSGVYLFLFNVEATTGSNLAHVSLVVDGSYKLEALAKSPDGSIITGGNSFVTYVKKNGKVWIQTASSANDFSINAWRTTFNGVLLYAV